MRILIKESRPGWSTVLEELYINAAEKVLKPKQKNIRKDNKKQGHKIRQKQIKKNREKWFDNDRQDLKCEVRNKKNDLKNNVKRLIRETVNT